MRNAIRILCTIGTLLTMAAPAQARDNAVLRNGFAISHDHRQVLGERTRLFFSESEKEFVDISTVDIQRIEKDETPTPAASLPAGTEVAAKPSPDLNAIVAAAARNNQLDADFVHSVIRAESNGNTKAVSRKGAQGLMQLMPETASALGVKNSFDADENVSAGSKYLRQLLERYHNDPLRALAAYNAGAGRVTQYRGVPPYPETRAYIASIIRDFNRRKAEAARRAVTDQKVSRKKNAAAGISLPHSPVGD